MFLNSQNQARTILKVGILVQLAVFFFFFLRTLMKCMCVCLSREARSFYSDSDPARIERHPDSVLMFTFHLPVIDILCMLGMLPVKPT